MKKKTLHHLPGAAHFSLPGAFGIPPRVFFVLTAIAFHSLFSLAPFSHAQDNRPSGTVVTYSGGFLPAFDPGTRFTAIDAEGHTLALTTDGSVVAWGHNNWGESQVPAAAQSEVVAISAGNQFSLALKSDGSVVAWGGDWQGQTTVPPAAQSGVVAVAGGGFHALALTQDGSVMVWGGESLGLSWVPPAAQSNVVAITAGERQSAALKRDGSVVAWGDRRSVGEIEVPVEALSGVVAISGGLALKKDGSVVNLSGLAVPVEAQSGVVAIDAGSGHTVALKSDGSVVAWGSGWGGESTAPEAVQSGVAAVAAGHGRTVTLKDDGSILVWGSDWTQAMVPGVWPRGVVAVSGGLALKKDGSVVNLSGLAVPVEAQSGVMAIASGIGQTLALKTDGSVFAWNGSGQTTVPAEAQSDVVAMAAGGGNGGIPYEVRTHSVALKNDGSVVAWGDNYFGQTTVPVEARSGVIAIDAGNFHTVALKSDGSVVAWGDTGLSFGRPATVPPEARSGVVAVSAGSHHTLALKSDGSVVAWGSNLAGETVVPAQARSGVVAIAASGVTSMALKNDGSVVVWGNEGQPTVLKDLPPLKLAIEGIHAIALEPQPSFQLRELGNSTVITWNADLPGAALEMSTDLLEWESVPDVPLEGFYPLPTEDSDEAYYRLRFRR